MKMGGFLVQFLPRPHLNQGVKHTGKIYFRVQRSYRNQNLATTIVLSILIFDTVEQTILRRFCVCQPSKIKNDSGDLLEPKETTLFLDFYASG